MKVKLIAGAGILAAAVLATAVFASTRNGDRHPVTPVGEWVAVDARLRAQVSEIGSVDSDAKGPWLAVGVRFANSGARQAMRPSFAIECAGHQRGGGFLGSSTIYLAGEIKAKTELAGTLDLVARGDRRSSVVTPVCETPAYVRVTPMLASGDKADPVAWVRIPDALVDQLNAKRRE